MDWQDNLVARRAIRNHFAVREITARFWEVLITKKGERRAQDTRSAWQQHDLDGSGHIDLAELNNLCCKLGVLLPGLLGVRRVASGASTRAGRPRPGLRLPHTTPLRRGSVSATTRSRDSRGPAVDLPPVAPPSLVPSTCPPPDSPRRQATTSRR